MERKEYYWLPTDSYGQPSGMVVPVTLTESEYKARRRYEYIYDNYYSALTRAND